MDRNEPPADPARQAFLDAMAAFGQSEGLPPIAGKVFALIVYDGGPISFGVLADRLQVSRASISTSVRVLEHRGLICRTQQPGARGVFFDLPPTPHASLMQGISARASAACHMIGTVMDSMPANPDRQTRLAELAKFYTTLERMSETAAQQLTGDPA